MAKKSFDEKTLKKGQARKLEALRKSLGDDIADKAFGDWMAQQAIAGPVERVDQNAMLIADTLEPMAKSGKLRIQRGGYIVRRGPGRVIVEAARD